MIVFYGSTPLNRLRVRVVGLHMTEIMIAIN